MSRATYVLQMMLLLTLAVLTPTRGSCQQTIRDDLSVVANVGIPYYATYDMVGVTAPLGQFGANSRFCMENHLLTAGGKSPVMEIDMPGGKKVYAVFNTAEVTRDPTNDKKCNQDPALATGSPSAPIKANEAGSSSSGGADEVNSPDTQREISEIVRYAESRLTSRGFDAQIAADLKKINDDPAAKAIDTKVAIAHLYRDRGWGQELAPSDSVEPRDAWVYDDKLYGYGLIAGRWYKMALDQIKKEYPDIVPNGNRTADDPTGSIHALVYIAQVGVSTAPTPSYRKSERIRLEQKRHQEDPFDLKSPPRTTSRQVCLSDCATKKSRCDSSGTPNCGLLHASCLKQCPE
jgi:hypothetical protein